MQVLGLTESHVKEEITTTHTVKRNNNAKRTYELFFGGIKGNNTFSGAGIAIESSLRPRFKRVTDRIVTASFQLDQTHQANVIVAYAPTLARSEKEPQICEDFYSELEKITLKHVKDKHLLLVIGDFNAKTGSGHTHFPNNIGKYGKGHLNSNGEHLLQYAKENNLVLTNTLFPHKLCHRTTWTSMERTKNHLSSDGKARRNPYRNQIDYIMIKTLYRKLIMDSRSHSGISTPTDHKLVKTKIKLEWWRLNKQFKKSTKLNIDRLRDPVVRKQYQDRLQDKLVKERGNNEHPNDSWNKISKICKETAKETIGIKGPNKPSHPLISLINYRKSKENSRVM